MQLIDLLELRGLLLIGELLANSLAHCIQRSTTLAISCNRRRRSAAVDEYHDRIARFGGRGDGRHRARTALHDEEHERRALRLTKVGLELIAQSNLSAKWGALRASINQEEVRMIRIERRALTARGRDAAVFDRIAVAAIEKIPAIRRHVRRNANDRVLVADGSHRVANQLHHAGVGAARNDPNVGTARDVGEAVGEERLEPWRQLKILSAARHA